MASSSLSDLHALSSPPLQAEDRICIPPTLSTDAASAVGLDRLPELELTRRSSRYGEEAAEAAIQGLGAPGHAVGSAWVVFKIKGVKAKG